MLDMTQLETSEESMANGVEKLDEGELIEQLQLLLAEGQPEAVRTFIQLLPVTDITYVVHHLDPEQQTRLLELLGPEASADLLEHFVDEHAADFLDDLPAKTAAAIVEEMDSDDQADILSELEDHEASAILKELTPEDAEDVRRLIDYGQDTAGGIMITELLVFQINQTIRDVHEDLVANRKAYREYDVQYLYVVDEAERLVGVVRMGDIMLSKGGRTLEEVMIANPAKVNVNDHLSDLEDFFDHHAFNALPVVDDEGVLRGVVRRAAVEYELGEEADRALLRFGGIVGGEELRSMPIRLRVARRMLFLLPNIALFVVSMSVIALFEPTIAKLTALAAFLPLVGGMSGAAGNQAVAVSMRELTLGLIRPGDIWRVAKAELPVAFINGLAVGACMGIVAAAVALTMNTSPWIGLVILAAYVINCMLATVFGGTIPIMLKAVKIDPAMASSPIMATVSDAGAFFFTLLFAAMSLSALT